MKDLLGGYNMVLSLNEHKINEMFAELHEKNVILKKWYVSYNSTDLESHNLTRRDLIEWKNASQDNRNQDIAAKQEQLNSSRSKLEQLLQENEITEDQLSEYITDKANIRIYQQKGDSGQPEFYSKMYASSKKCTEFRDQVGIKKMAEMETLHGEIRKINSQLDRVEGYTNEYNIGMEAETYPPEIFIPSAPNMYKEIYLQINLKNIIIYELDDISKPPKKYEYGEDKEDQSYAVVLRVPLTKKQLQHASSGKIIKTEKDGSRQVKSLRDEGFDDQKFTVESLYLDFTSDPVVSFEMSILPSSKADANRIIGVVKDYLKIESKPHNYSLGYVVQNDNAQENKKALLYPTGLDFSATGVAGNTDKSVINYLMQVNGNPDPNGPDTGLISESLLDHRTSEEINAIFAIQREIFKETYLKKMVEAVAKEIAHSIEELPGVEARYYVEENLDFFVVYTDSGVNIDHGKLSFLFQTIENKGTGISLKYVVEHTVNAFIWVQSVKEKKVWLGLKTEKEVSQYRKPVQFTTNKEGGLKGKYRINVKTDAKGKFDVEPAYEKELQFAPVHEAVATYSHEDNTLISIITGQASTETSAVRMTPSTSRVMKTLVDLDDHIDELNLKDFETMVILPAANTYTYKNLRQEDNRFWVDATYATIKS